MQQDLLLHAARLRRDSDNSSPILGSLSDRHSNDASPVLSEARSTDSPEQRARRRLDHGPHQSTFIPNFRFHTAQQRNRQRQKTL